MRPYVTLLVILPLFLSCDKQNRDGYQHHTLSSPKTKYTCSMHPQIVQDEPGTCPVCGMTLVAGSSSRDSGGVMLNETQIRLANITTEKVSKRRIGETLVINGTLVVNEEESEVVSSRASGRIEKLMIKETGQFIEKGKPLYVLYSESLLTLQQEYLLAKEQYALLGKTETRYKSFLDAAERKLLLYGLTKNQIDNLSNKNSVDPRVAIVSPSNGIAKEIYATEGQYVEEGTLLYKVEDISTLWIEAELYPGESSWVKQGDKIRVKVNGFESVPVESEVTFLSPEYRANTQILVMRAKIINPGLQFKPGQQVQALFSHSNHDAISIPVDAVIQDGKRTHVYVQSGHNTFRPRMVKTGIEGFEQVEITEGLTEGDTVAVTGAYLLYSETILKIGGSAIEHNH